MDELRKHWQEQFEAARNVDPKLMETAAAWLRNELLGLQWDEAGSPITALEGLERLMEGPAPWPIQDVNEGGRFPLPFHSLGGGMRIRNWLREAGYGEDYFGVELDYIYAGVVELAVLGERITSDTMEQYDL